MTMVQGQARQAAGALAFGKRVVRSTGLTRKRVAAVRMCCERNVYARVGRKRSDTNGQILCYHSIGTPEWGVNDVAPGRFARQMEVALRAGRRFVPAKDIALGLGQPGDLAVTFDDGLASVLNAVPVMETYKIPYTLFIVSEWAEGKSAWDRDDLFLSWREIARLAERGADIASHSMTHPNFGSISLDEGVHEMVASRDHIARKLAVAPSAFAIPFGQSRDWSGELTKVAHAAGYETVYAQSAERRSPGTVARTFITRYDGDAVFRGALGGRFDRWEEWV